MADWFDQQGIQAPTVGTAPLDPLTKRTTADQPTGLQPVVPGTPDIPSSGAGHFNVDPVTGRPWTMNLGQPVTSTAQNGLDTSNQRAVQDAWLGFVGQNYSNGQGPISLGGSNGGFYAGGQASRGNLQPVVDAFNAKNGTHATVAGGDKIDFGDGKGPTDVITSGGNWWFGGASGGQGGGSGGGSGSGGSGDGSGSGVVANTGAIQEPTMAGSSSLSGMALPTAMTTSAAAGPIAPTYNYTPYTLPTAADARATPGYQFALDQGTQGLNRSLAATSGVASGAALKEAAQFNQGLADSTYQNTVANSLNAYGANTGQGQFAANYGLGAQGQQFGQNLATNQTNFGQGLATNQFNLGAQNQGFNQGLATNQFNLGAQNQGFNQNLATNQFNLGAQNQYWGQGFAQNQNAFNQYNTNQNSAFNQWLALAQLGNPGNPYA